MSVVIIKKILVYLNKQQLSLLIKLKRFYSLAFRLKLLRLDPEASLVICD